MWPNISLKKFNLLFSVHISRCGHKYESVLEGSSTFPRALTVESIEMHSITPECRNLSVHRESSSWRKKRNDGPNSPSGWTWSWCSGTRSLWPGWVRLPCRITERPISTSTWCEPTQTSLSVCSSVLTETLMESYNESHTEHWCLWWTGSSLERF